jgi:hypothetical protein
MYVWEKRLPKKAVLFRQPQRGFEKSEGLHRKNSLPTQLKKMKVQRTEMYY